MKTNGIVMNYVGKQIVISRRFATKAQNTNSGEYVRLTKVKEQFPSYEVVVRDPIKKNPNKQTYPNLTYDFMRSYILQHGTDEEIAHNILEFRELRELSKIYKTGYSYPRIKHWFLAKYPRFHQFETINKDETDEDDIA